MKKIKITLRVTKEEYNQLFIATNYDIESAVQNLLYHKYLSKKTTQNKYSMQGILNQTYGGWLSIGKKPKFTRNEFREYFMNNKHFKKMFNKYKDSEFEKSEKPSFVFNKNLKNIKIIKLKRTSRGKAKIPVTFIDITGKETKFDSILAFKRNYPSFMSSARFNKLKNGNYSHLGVSIILGNK